MITQRKTAVAMLVSMMLLFTCYLSSQAASQQPTASAPAQDTTDQDITLLRKRLLSLLQADCPPIERRRGFGF